VTDTARPTDPATTGVAARLTFADPTLAASIDRAEARLSAAFAGVATREGAPALDQELGGGRAVLVRPGSPVNKLIGAGFEGVLDDSELAAVETAWAAQGEPMRVELSTLAVPEVGTQLSDRGYRLNGFDNVLALGVAPTAGVNGIDVGDADDDDEWRRLAVDGSMHPDDDAVTAEGHDRQAVESIYLDLLGAAGFRRLVARVDGEPAGVATLRLDGEVALLCGATTVPRFRRRGVQAGMLAARMNIAHRAGARVAVVTTAPGSQSMRNVMRRGGSLLYVRAVMVLPGVR
jgi:hypothetical protein